MRFLRSIVYRLGFRPKSGSILCSPTLAYLYGFRDAQREHERFSLGSVNPRFDIPSPAARGFEQARRFNRHDGVDL